MAAGPRPELVRTPDGTRDGAPATAVAVRGDRIVAVGDAADARIKDLIGATTEVVDMRNRALLRGFQDAHVHPAFAGVTMIGCNLIGTGKLDEELARISAYAAAHPEKEWIAGSGWRTAWFERGTPSRELLDQVTGGRADWFGLAGPILVVSGGARP